MAAGLGSFGLALIAAPILLAFGYARLGDGNSFGFLANPSG